MPLTVNPSASGATLAAAAAKTTVISDL
jgi:hypothetical protein